MAAEHDPRPGHPRRSRCRRRPAHQATEVGRDTAARGEGMTELSYDQLVAAVRAEGVDLREVSITSGGKTYPSRNMCRCHSGDVSQTRHVVGGSKVRAWAPEGHVTVHITAGDKGSRTVQQYILDILL